MYSQASSTVAVDTLKLIEFAQFIPFLFAYLFYFFLPSFFVPPYRYCNDTGFLSGLKPVTFHTVVYMRIDIRSHFYA